MLLLNNGAGTNIKDNNGNASLYHPSEIIRGFKNQDCYRKIIFFLIMWVISILKIDMTIVPYFTH
jgi:hypothetical protein